MWLIFSFYVVLWLIKKARKFENYCMFVGPGQLFVIVKKQVTGAVRVKVFYSKLQNEITGYNALTIRVYS